MRRIGKLPVDRKRFTTVFSKEIIVADACFTRTFE